MSNFSNYYSSNYDDLIAEIVFILGRYCVHKNYKVILQLGLMEKIDKLLTNENIKVRKITVWIISNITAETEVEIQKIIDNKIMNSIINLAQKDDLEVKEECIWVIRNALVSGSPTQVKYLTELNALEPLCDILNIDKERIISISLEGIQSIFECISTYYPKMLLRLITNVDSSGGLTLIDNLQLHENTNIQKTAHQIIEDYYTLENELE